jgi:hypothetical protein
LHETSWNRLYHSSIRFMRARYSKMFGI